MKRIALSILVLLPLIVNSQIEIKYDHCNCIDVIDQLDPVLSGSYERKCDGLVIERGEFENGQKTGLWESYSMTGQKIREYRYESGVLNGEVRLYYSDGSKKVEGRFDNNRKDGLWQFYNDKGRLQKEGTYEDGKAIALWHIYNEKGKKTEITYDFTGSKYVEENEQLRYYEDQEIIQNDNKGEWFILFYPDLEKGADIEPIEGIGLANDLYVNHMEIPLEYWDTYVSYLYKSTLTYRNGVLVDINVEQVDDHVDGVATFPFIVITNEQDKLERVEHTDLSRQLLEYKIKEALFLTGPHKMIRQESVVLYTPFVINDIKNRW